MPSGWFWWRDCVFDTYLWPCAHGRKQKYARWYLSLVQVVCTLIDLCLFCYPRDLILKGVKRITFVSYIVKSVKLSLVYGGNVVLLNAPICSHLLLKLEMAQFDELVPGEIHIAVVFTITCVIG